MHEDNLSETEPSFPKVLYLICKILLNANYFADDKGKR